MNEVMKKKQADEHEKFSQLLSKKKYISFENFYRIRTRAVMSQSYILYLLCSNTFYKIIPRCSKGSETQSKLIQKLVVFKQRTMADFNGLSPFFRFEICPYILSQLYNHFNIN